MCVILCMAGATNSMWVLMILSGSMLASWTASLTWRSRHLGPVLVTENLMAWGSLEYSGCSPDRCEAMLLVATLPRISVWCWQILVCASVLVTTHDALTSVISAPARVTRPVLLDVAVREETAREVGPGEQRPHRDLGLFH